MSMGGDSLFYFLTMWWTFLSHAIIESNLVLSVMAFAGCHHEVPQYLELSEELMDGCYENNLLGCGLLPKHGTQCSAWH